MTTEPRRPQSSHKTYRVLLVEDNLGDVVLVQEASRASGVPCVLDHVANGHLALEYLARTRTERGTERPDMVLVDLNLPGVDGFEVLDHIKTDAFLRTIPVIVLTSSMSSEDVRKAYERHANAYIVKRFNLEELETVFRCLGEFWFEVAALPR